MEAVDAVRNCVQTVVQVSAQCVQVCGPPEVDAGVSRKSKCKECIRITSVASPDRVAQAQTNGKSLAQKLSAVVT